MADSGAQSPRDEPAEASGRAAVAATALGLLAVFLLGLGAGYVYAHEPAAPVIDVRLDSPVPPAAGPRELRGSIGAVGPDFIEVVTAEGSERLALAPNVVVEQLRPIEGAVPEGAAVNVGGNRTESGFVITGVVVVDGGR